MNCDYCSQQVTVDKNPKPNLLMLKSHNGSEIKVFLCDMCFEKQCRGIVRKVKRIK